MSKRGGMYSSNKRRKELQRQTKQEEKRLKRQKSATAPETDCKETKLVDPEQSEPDGTSREAD